MPDAGKTAPGVLGQGVIHARFTLQRLEKTMLRKLRSQLLREFGLMFGALILLPLNLWAAEPLPHPAATCFSIPQARIEIARNHLAGSFKVMAEIAKQYRSEALAGKLCRKGELFIYEVTLLRHDGRVIHVFANARDGHVTKARNDK